MGGELYGKIKQKNEKPKSFFFSIFIFAYSVVKGLFVWLTVDDSWIVCLHLLPNSYGQTKKMAKVRLLSSAIVIDVFDSRNIQDRSLLKVYNKDPAHAFNHTPKTVNGDLRVSVPGLFLISLGQSNRPFRCHVLLMIWGFSPLIVFDNSLFVPW